MRSNHDLRTAGGAAEPTPHGPHAWGIAAGTTAFATFGTILGLTIIATGPRDVPDLTYHASILAALAVTLAALLRRDGRGGERSMKPDANRREQIPRSGQPQPGPAAEPPGADQGQQRQE